MTPAQYLAVSAKSAARAVAFRRNRKRRIAAAQPTRGDMLHMLDWATWRTAIPDVPTRVVLAKAIRDSPVDRLNVIIAWMLEGKEFDLLSLALQANVSTDELRAHLNGTHPLHRDSIRFLAAFNPTAVGL